MSDPDRSIADRIAFLDDVIRECRDALGKALYAIPVDRRSLDHAFQRCEDALAKNPNPSGQITAEASGHHSPEASGPVGLGPPCIHRSGCVSVHRCAVEGCCMGRTNQSEPLTVPLTANPTRRRSLEPIGDRTLWTRTSKRC
jgi:hypothetical protein